MKKLLVIRNDKLGDLILTLPALKMIKSSVKDIKIDCLLDEKYSDIQCMTEYMDSAICNHENLIDEINTQNYDFSISFFSTFNIGYKLWKSNIKKRYAPATKLAQIFYNKKIMQKRSSSEKSEYEYNIDLAKYFLNDNSFDIASTDNQCMMVKNEKTVSADKKNLVFVHPFTGGSSKTLSCDDFVDLCKELDRLNDCSFILHCDVNDHDKCLELEKKASNLDITTIAPTNNLVKMFENINQCDLFIAGSTGPLHVAAALNKKTVGFYPSKISSSLLRWDTINTESNKLSFCDIGCDDKYIRVDLNEVAKLINLNLLD